LELIIAAEQWNKNATLKIYKIFTPLFIGNLVAGNIFYFQPDQESCKEHSVQFIGLVNFVIFALTVGYIMSIYYIAIMLGIVCGPQQDELESRNAVIPNRRHNQVSVDDSVEENNSGPIALR
jgi:hypothetical protein